jgi:hypothetical protein
VAEETKDLQADLPLTTQGLRQYEAFRVRGKGARSVICAKGYLRGDSPSIGVRVRSLGLGDPTLWLEAGGNPRRRCRRSCMTLRISVSNRSSNRARRACCSRLKIDRSPPLMTCSCPLKSVSARSN